MISSQLRLMMLLFQEILVLLPCVWQDIIFTPFNFWQIGKRSFLQVRLSYYPNCVSCYQLSNLCLNGNVELNPGPAHISTRKSQLSCLSLNARSIVFKKVKLRARLASNAYNLVAVTETWLDPSENNFEILPCDYLVQRRDRSRHGGEVLLTCSNDLVCIRRPEFETESEVLWYEVIIPNPHKRI